LTTATSPSAGQSADLDWLLEQFVKRVPHARSAVVASTDGVRKHTHGLGVDDSDRLSAIATGLFSLGKGIGHLHGQAGGEVRQVVVEHDGALLFVSAAGAGAVLAVLASGEADPALIGYEMAQLVKSVSGYLSTPPRGAGL
jgi:predicted regulator of Ras-like GTPase activity (Roadblock/LC7/MglB family)